MSQLIVPGSTTTEVLLVQVFRECTVVMGQFSELI